MGDVRAEAIRPATRPARPEPRPTDAPPHPRTASDGDQATPAVRGSIAHVREWGGEWRGVKNRNWLVAL